jgi:hypothetical protein
MQPIRNAKTQQHEDTPKVKHSGPSLLHRTVQRKRTKTENVTA